MVRSFADWGSERYLPKVIKSGIGPPVHILIFDFLRPSSRTPVLSSDPEAEWTTGHVAVPTVIPKSRLSNASGAAIPLQVYLTLQEGWELTRRFFFLSPTS